MIVGLYFVVVMTFIRIMVVIVVILRQILFSVASQ